MNRSGAWRVALIVLIALGVANSLRGLNRNGCQAMRETGTGVSRIDLGARVVHVAAGPKGLWAIRWLGGGTKTTQSDLVELDPATGRIVGSPVALRGFGVGLDVGEDAVWVGSNVLTKHGRGTLVRVDPVSHRIVSQLRLGLGTSSVSVGEGGVWVAISAARTVVRVDPTGRRVVATVRLGSRPDLVLARAGAVWVGAEGALHRIDPATGQRTGDMEGSLTNVSSDAVWVVGPGAPNGRLLRINPATVRPVGPFMGLDTIPATVGVAGRDAWVGKYFDSCDSRGRPITSVGWFRVDPATLKPLSGPVHVGSNPGTPAFAAGAFWIAPDIGNDVIRIDLASAARVRPPAQVSDTRS